MYAPLVLQPPHLQGEELCIGDFRDHPHQFFLYKLVRSDGTVVELFPLLCVAESCVIACHRRANRSPGNAGAPGYRNDLATGAASTGDTQQESAQSGSGWISAAASVDSKDKSNFSTPFQQGFGGIANNQTYVIGSPDANVSASPVTGPPTTTGAGVVGPSAMTSPLMIALLVLAGVVAAKFLK